MSPKPPGHARAAASARAQAQPCPPERFHAAFQKAHNDPVHGKFLTPYSPEDFAKMETYLNADGTVGGAVKTADDGVREGVSLFNQGGPKGSGRKLLSRDGRPAFSQASRRDRPRPTEGLRIRRLRSHRTNPMDDQYAPEGWDYERFGRPDIVVMEVPDP
jgi:CubicO group peptidase (beta-lactamase class C family)